jgi:hypothetical protein
LTTVEFPTRRAATGKKMACRFAVAVARRTTSYSEASTGGRPLHLGGEEVDNHPTSGNETSSMKTFPPKQRCFGKGGIKPNRLAFFLWGCQSLEYI